MENQKENHFSEDDIINYLNQWRDTEGWSDNNIVLDSFYLDSFDLGYICNFFVSIGGIDSSQCFPEYKAIEKEIERLSSVFEKYTEKKKNKVINTVFQGIVVFSCKDCNTVSFLIKENIEIYRNELKTCWSCKHGNIEKIQL